MTITTIDRETCRELRETLQRALSLVLEHNGLLVSVGSARFTATTVDFKLSIAVKPRASQGGAAPVSAAEVKAAVHLRDKATAQSCDADPAWLGLTITHQGAQYRIAGLNPRKPKNCLMLVRVSDGKSFGGTPSLVRTAIAREALAVSAS